MAFNRVDFLSIAMANYRSATNQRDLCSWFDGH